MVRVQTIRYTKLISVSLVQDNGDEKVWRLVFSNENTGEKHGITIVADNDELGI